MAFDKETRNKLQKLVGKSRELLTEEFTRQFQGTYGIQPTGEITPLDKLGRLDDATRSVARLLRERIQHIASQSAGRGVVKEAINRVLREQAFTVINRFAALKMAESRGIVQECVGGGFDSKGFKVFLTVAGTALGDTYDRYRVFLYCLFDELSLDLGVLFDRYSPYGLLFPRETALKELFELLNQAELKHLWAEDETIGWIYQYFNDEAERKKMRKESSAPRNSRELAVRNQFFTPRYVVQFLVDNTLGRTWYEMLQGDTRLKESCEYLVRRPNEIFLAQGQEAPKEETKDDLSQEELLKQPVHIPFRATKDPREIRLLDPACGSMHFGLYAFDLYELIYEEAWDRDLCPKLKADYPDKVSFLREMPRLIIEHNLHGVDIDPRAAQIAGLSLWLRAQKSWQRLKVKPADRPQIKRSNIVCAEPMPGEVEHLRDFCESLNQPAIGKMVELIFDKMKLAGEAGTLLKIEEEIAHLVTTAKKDWQAGPKLQQSDLFAEFTPARATQSELGLDMSGITDEAFWDKAEERIYQALRDYAEQADGDFTRRLFAEDAARGFAFIDVCRKRYDVVVMNPPFGEYPATFKDRSKTHYFSGGHDILTAFVQRILELCVPNGLTGAITSRTVFFVPTTRTWREEIPMKHQLLQWFDLGEGVLDDAMVETCMYTISNSTASSPAIFSSVKPTDIRNAIYDVRESQGLPENIYCLNQSAFESIPGQPLAYWVDAEILRSFAALSSLSESGIEARVGLQTGDDFRFIRCWWEVPSNRQQWWPHAKGGENLPYATDIHLVVNWAENGREMKSQDSIRLNMYMKNDPARGLSEGLTFPYRTHRFSPALMPSGVIAGVAGMGIFSENVDLRVLVSFLNSSLANELIDVRLGLREINALYQAGTISPIPFPEIDDKIADKLKNLGQVIWELSSARFLVNEEFLEAVSKLAK